MPVRGDSENKVHDVQDDQRNKNHLFGNFKASRLVAGFFPESVSVNGNSRKVKMQEKNAYYVNQGNQYRIFNYIFSLYEKKICPLTPRHILWFNIPILQTHYNLFRCPYIHSGL